MNIVTLFLGKGDASYHCSSYCNECHLPQMCTIDKASIVSLQKLFDGSIALQFYPTIKNVLGKAEIQIEKF